jgi:hypothetical protein
MDEARPLLSCECVECESHRGERAALQDRVLALEADKDVLMEQGESIARERDDRDFRIATAEMEIDRLQARVTALTAALMVALREGFRGMKSVDDASSSLVLSVPGDYLAKIKAALDAGTGET